MILYGFGSGPKQSSTFNIQHDICGPLRLMRRLRVGKEKGNKDALISYDSEAEHTTFLKEKK